MSDLSARMSFFMIDKEWLESFFNWNWGHHKAGCIQLLRCLFPAQVHTMMNIGLFAVCALLLIARVPFVHCSCSPPCYFYEEPADAIVIAGNDARFNCGAEIDTYHYVDWNLNGLVYGPWPSAALYNEVSYPDDADYSIGTYDIVINNVMWEKHNQMTVACQISEERMRTKFASLTVLVPPEISMLSPSRDGLVEVDSKFEEIELSCLTNYATPTFEVEWRIDGVPLSSIKENHVEKQWKNGELMRVNSAVTVSLHQRRLKNPTVVGTGSSESLGVNPEGRRKDLEPHYHVVYHVSCQIVNNTVDSSRKILSSWVVFKSSKTNTFGYCLFGNVPVHWYHILIGVIVILTVVATIIIFVRRRRATVKESSDEGNDHEYGFGDSKETLSQSAGESSSMASLNREADSKECFAKKANPQHDLPTSPLTISTSASDLDDSLVPVLPAPMSPFSHRIVTRNRSAYFVGESNYDPLHQNERMKWATVDRLKIRKNETADDSDHYCRMRSLTDQYISMRSPDLYPSYYSPWPLTNSARYEEINMSTRPRVVLPSSCVNTPLNQKYTAESKV